MRGAGAVWANYCPACEIEVEIDEGILAPQEEEGDFGRASGRASRGARRAAGRMAGEE